MRAEHLIITGGTGYIGSRLVECALAEGRTVTLLGQRDGAPGTHRIDWTLGDPFPSAAVCSNLSPQVQAVVHCAHAWQTENADRHDNVEGSALLLRDGIANSLGARVFLSSQSARKDAPNFYGRMKWAIEQQLPDVTSLRVGLVYGGPRRAMYGLLCRLATFGPILPMLEPNRLVQPIHLDEVVLGILAAADRRADGVLALAGPTPVRFGTFLRALALAYAGRSLRIVPIPLWLALLGCTISARLPGVPSVDRERVLGLAGTLPIDSAADLASLGVQVHPFAGRLAVEPDGWRALLKEARRVFRQVAGPAAPLSALRQYARSCSDGAIAWPWGWRLEMSPSCSEHAKRLRLMVRIAEASSSPEALTASRVRRLLRLGRVLLSEGLLFPLRRAGRLFCRAHDA